MIILATVVFPEALPPPSPAREEEPLLIRSGAVGQAMQMVPEVPHLYCSHRWQRPPWTECHARCTMGAVLLCRWYACLCAAGVAQTCTGWWYASGVSAQYPRVEGVCPGTLHCYRKERHTQPSAPWYKSSHSEKGSLKEQAWLDRWLNWGLHKNGHAADPKEP